MGEAKCPDVEYLSIGCHQTYPAKPHAAKLNATGIVGSLASRIPDKRDVQNTY
jgi:hypothetical protein